MRHFAGNLPCAIFVAGAALPLLLAACDKLTSQGGNPTMALLQDGSERVCIAADVQKALRDLIVPKAAEMQENMTTEARMRAVSGISLSYSLTTLQSFDSAVSKASCNTTVAISGTGSDKTVKFRIDYQVSPSAENRGSFVITADVYDAHALAFNRVSNALDEVANEEEEADIARQDAEQRQRLLAVVNERWLQGAWIGSNAASADCGSGQAVWFEQAHVLEGALGKGRWSLAADQLHIVGGDCPIFCARGRFRHQMTNLSPKITANWLFASPHSRGGRFHSSAA